MSNGGEITMLLRRMDGGDSTAQQELLELIYDELRDLARSKLAANPTEQSLSATALVHEAWLRLVPMDDQRMRFENRRHFYGAAAEAMRNILVDQYRRRVALKRRSTQRLPDDFDLISTPSTKGDHKFSAGLDWLALHEALDQLETTDSRAASVVKLRFFVGLSLQEIAELLELSRATVVRELSFAKAWLRTRLDDDHDVS